MGRSKRIFLFTVLVAAPLVACNAILGIDDFRRVDCVGVCDEGEAGPDRVEPDNFVPDGGRDTGPDAPPGVGPVSWAQFPMPNYKDGVDAGTTLRPLDYEVNDEDVVTDKVTGYPWRRKVIGFVEGGSPGDDKTEDAARTDCQKLPNGPWRLPKRIELVTLLSYGDGLPFVDTTAFPGVKAVRVWTSSEVRPFNGKYWAVNFETGALEQLDTKNQFAKALCVKDKQ
jgi:hypothetical protein